MSILSKLAEEKSIKLKGGLYHQSQVRFCYNSNRIEGSRLSEEQTRYIFETNTINTASDDTANVDDIIEAASHFTCFDYMIDTASKDLSEDIIKEFHRILKSNTSDSKKEWFNVGNYKSKPNMVGDMETTAPKDTAKAISDLLVSYNGKQAVSFEDIVEFHYLFEKIHPFQDGNGRVGRMIMFKECLKFGVMPFIIDERHKLFYYRGLKEFKTAPGYLLDTCRSAQDVYEKLVMYFEDKQ
ncbi:MAG: Fic family protein [Endomicrobia bacterium]|nr:Fic family protein [Endomicrobiia bacterium]MCL2507265.1 Fic family protein [Endomicrobiia bacterium]